MFKLVIATVTAASIAAPSIAQTQAPAPAQATATKKEDPNEKVCVKQEVTGSRLGAKRVCMTRAEWADRKLQDQQELTRVQTQRSGPSGN